MFCAEYENATLALGWAETSAYTTLVETGRDAAGCASAVVCYERQGYGSGGYHKHNPPNCDPKFSTIFCATLRAEPCA